MTDIVDAATRSRMMSGIRGKDTKPELLVRSYLHRNGLRYRLNVKELPGKPDIVLPKYRTVVFVHGCFWHQHPGCKYAVMPGNNKAFWKNKLEGNAMRDKKNIALLSKCGWIVHTIWECQVHSEKRLAGLVRKIRHQPR
jgi:DNA mismatch endonuclease (patch repair protein)